MVKMENVKSDIDKIMDKFNDSVTHSAPKKLSFEFLDHSLNDSVGAGASKKRKMSNTHEGETPLLNGSESDSTKANVSGSSLSSSYTLPPSPWETRRMKADLIETRIRVSKLKQEVERERKLRIEIETLCDSKVSELKKQCEFSANKAADMEKHLQVVRRREHAAKQEQLKVEKELSQQKLHFEDTVHKLKRLKTEIEENARHIEHTLSMKVSEYRRHAEKIELDLELVSEDLASAQSQLSEYQTRAAAYDELKLRYEQEHQDLEIANSRVKELEYEIASYTDWKEITENAQSRLLSLPELDKELVRLRLNNKNLQELLGNKLLLEEQVHDLRTRLDKEESGRNEAVTLQVKLQHMEKELKEWVQIAQDHCLPNVLVSPIALRSRIEQLLQNDIVMASEKTLNKSEAKTMETELHEYMKRCAIYNKNIEDLNLALKRHKNFKERVQRKLLLVSKERDCYKQLLENFEKDLTMSNTTGTEMTNVEAQLRIRIDMLEKTLTGYKELCINLEKDQKPDGHQNSSSNGAVGGDQLSEIALSATEGYDNVKRELDSLRMENDRLRRRKEELELELEHRCLKGDFNIGKYKVVHMQNNPAAQAYENADQFVEKLQAEIERLKRRNKKLEEDNEVTLARLNETTNMTVNIKEANQLRAELESNIAKMKKMKECFKSANMEFREVCYLLFGYRIDRVGANTNYKLSSMYADGPDDYLNFRLNESNVLDMLETPYSATLRSLIESQLIANKSLPTFLSALTLELFNRSTVTLT